ncbi:hypothetical protein EKA83_28035 [Pseudomonas veronii]|nr:hypothetical protein EKA83_28035 [Pseudomonas veronii]
MLAKTVQATRSSRMPALSLTTFASKLAPTGFCPDSWARRLKNTLVASQLQRKALPRALALHL